jgi:hypothetical protein
MWMGRHRRVRRTGLFAQHEVCKPLSEHDGRQIDIGAWNSGKQRRVGNAQAWHTIDPAMRISHGHRIGFVSHAARAGGVPDANRGPAHEFFQSAIVAEQLAAQRTFPIALADGCSS